MTDRTFEKWAEDVIYNDQPLTVRGGIPLFLAERAYRAGMIEGTMRERDYMQGKWCGECAHGIVEDPPCCTLP